MSKNLEHNTQHRQQARDLVIEQFKRSQRFNDWLGVYVDQIQDIEDALWDLYTKRGVDTAEGAQLDVLGVIVGQPRNGLDDTDYRTRIKVRIRLNRASGIADDIYDVFGLMLGNQIGAVSLQEAYPAGLIVQMNEYVDTSPAVLAEILREARGAGIDTSLVWLPSADGIFECSSDAAPEVDSPDEGFATETFKASVYNHGSSAPGEYTSIAHAPALNVTIAVGAQITTSSRIMRSTDGGQTWTAITPPTGAYWVTVAWAQAHNMFYAFGHDGTVIRSTTGTSWSVVATLTYGYTSMACSDSGLLVAVYGANRSATSTNGTSWTENNTGLNLNQVAYSSLENRFVAAGAPGLYYSTNGVSWTQGYAGPGSGQGYVAWNAKLQIFFAFLTAATGSFYSSTDGINWDIVVDATSEIWVAIAACGNKFLALTYNDASTTIAVFDGANLSTFYDASLQYGYSSMCTMGLEQDKAISPTLGNQIVAVFAVPSGGQLAGVLEA